MIDMAGVNMSGGKGGLSAVLACLLRLSYAMIVSGETPVASECIRGACNGGSCMKQADMAPREWRLCWLVGQHCIRHEGTK